MKALTLYYVPTCAFSAATMSFLMLRGADVQLVNLEQHPEAKETVKQVADGQMKTPTIEVEGEWKVAPPLTELKALLERWGLPAQAAPHK